MCVLVPHYLSVLPKCVYAVCLLWFLVTYVCVCSLSVCPGSWLRKCMYAVCVMVPGYLSMCMQFVCLSWLLNSFIPENRYSG